MIALLRTHEIAMLVDVRSIPASHHVPQFNRVAFTNTLAHAGIGYYYTGDMLGGRPRDPQMYRDGILPQGRADYLTLVDYAKVAAQPRYRSAVASLVALARVRAHGDHVQRGKPAAVPSAAPDRPHLASGGIPVYHLRHHGPMEVAPFEPVTLYMGRR